MSEEKKFKRILEILDNYEHLKEFILKFNLDEKDELGDNILMFAIKNNNYNYQIKYMLKLIFEKIKIKDDMKKYIFYRNNARSNIFDLALLKEKPNIEVFVFFDNLDFFDDFEYYALVSQIEHSFDDYSLKYNHETIFYNDFKQMKKKLSEKKNI